MNDMHNSEIPRIPKTLGRTRPLEIPREWFQEIAKFEADSEIGAGIPPLPSRRFKLIYATPELLLSILLNRAIHEGRATILECNGLPEGTQVRDVFWDPQYHAFAYKLEHESFAPVEPGQVIPRLEPEPLFTSVTVETRKQWRTEPPDDPGYWWAKCEGQPPQVIAIDLWTVGNAMTMKTFAPSPNHDGEVGYYFPQDLGYKYFCKINEP